MRKISLIVSVLLGFIGTVVYFVTIPTVDEEALVNVVIEAGDEKVLEDIYFNGYLYDYSDFQVTQEGVHTTKGLSYLENLDAPLEMDLQMLQKNYPEFINQLIYNTNIYSKNLVFSDSYLTSAHFQSSEGNYRIETEKIHLNLLDKTTGEIKSEIVNRGNNQAGDGVDVVGIYENYPTVKVLLSINTWGDNFSEESSRVILGEYNFETKTYSEEKLVEKQGGFYGDYINPNQSTALINHYSASEDVNYLFDYENGSLMPIEREGKVFLLDEDSRLFAVANVDGETVLQSYEMTDGGGLEPAGEVPLAIEYELTLKEDAFAFIEAELIGDYLYVIQNQENFESDGKVLPASIQVFDRTTGENVMSGSIRFDEKYEVQVRSGFIDSIGQLSAY